MTGTETDQGKQGSKKKGCMIAFGVIVALGILGTIVGGDGKPTGDSVAAEAAAPPVDVAARDISRAFQENEAKAKLAYDGKVLRVSGKVKDITLDFSDKPVIKLAGAGDVQGMGISQGGKMTDVAINGLSSEDAAAINKGAEMAFVCADGVDEVMGSAQLSGCSVAVAE